MKRVYYFILYFLINGIGCSIECELFEDEKDENEMFKFENIKNILEQESYFVELNEKFNIN